MDRGAAPDPARGLGAVLELGGVAGAGVLRRGADRSRAGLSRWGGGSSLAARRARLDRAVSGWCSALARNCDRRSAPTTPPARRPAPSRPATAATAAPAAPTPAPATARATPTATA